MVHTAIQPTPFADVNALLGLLLDETRATLRHEFVGMYLHGSLATGDFDPQSSDIDALIVTASEPDAATIAALAAMHRRIAAGGLTWAARLECSYIPRAALRRYDQTKARHPQIGADKPFAVRQHEHDWVIERHILRERGIVLDGPTAAGLIDPVSRAELSNAVRTILQGWWRQILEQPAWFAERVYQAFAVLTMCRALHTLRAGEVVSKPAAAAWAGDALGARWAPLIEQALAWRHDPGSGDPSDALAFVRFAIERADRRP
ncbi:MAG TPA: aminoglycoside adenylyltransferase domain-containing protein [Dehalococcoidia bacterium]|nr:aminoglycoside adenylyltransferase domain-containing protein [Dehalococcoidia bacterium]